MGEVFADAGYSTGYIGKWHLYGSPDGRYGHRESCVPASMHFGFEYWKACECTHDYNKSLYYEGEDPTPKYWEGYGAIAQTKDACEFMNKFKGSSASFFLALSWGLPHFPLNTAPKRYQDMYRDKDIVLRPNVPPAAREHTFSPRALAAIRQSSRPLPNEKLVQPPWHARNSEGTG